MNDEAEVTPVPANEYVRYHGSHEYAHGFYVVSGHSHLNYIDADRHAEVSETRYSLVPYERERDGGEDFPDLNNVRRGSFTVLPDKLIPDDYVNYRSTRADWGKPVTYVARPTHMGGTYEVTRVNPNGQGWRVCVYDTQAKAKEIADALNSATDNEVH